MSRWLSGEILAMPLSQLEEEIAKIERTPTRHRSVLDQERLADLREAAQRIRTGLRARGYYW